MPEIETNTPMPESDSSVEQKSGAETVEHPKRKKSQESLLGGLLLAAIVAGILFVIAAVAWAVWGGVKYNQAESKELSIATLGGVAKEAVEEVVEAAKEAVALPEKDKSSEAKPNATTTAEVLTAVSVLNGGGVNGSAGTLGDALKKEGFANVSPGNATGNYANVIIYYADNVAKEAEILKTSVAKTYPRVTTAKAIAGNKETSTSPLTVIIGK